MSISYDDNHYTSVPTSNELDSYICADTEGSFEDLLRLMADREEWRERERDRKRERKRERESRESDLLI